ncbi:MAG: HAD-IC family P-type ATPase, partial [Candidatus Neomarinimicrobiota bacterium]
EQLASLGYEPEFNLADLQTKVGEKNLRNLYIKIGIAGFAFGNIMLLSLPEYLNNYGALSHNFQIFFSVLNLLLAVPVLFYSATDYFKSAWGSLRQKVVNMDVPISLGILTLFIRSVYEISTLSGFGWMDSFTGLVFLLLIGKLFQEKTYQALSFERDYKSYFPVSVIRLDNGEETSIALSQLKVRDRYLVRNNEIIPADSILINGTGLIDYSFITGESDAHAKVSGDLLYAGGKHQGGVIELEVVKDVSQSYLTQLWNNDAFNKHPEAKITTFANNVSKYFTGVVLLIALSAALYWIPNFKHSINAFTAVLIIACPCALALSTPFTLGNTMRIYGRKNFYIKNTAVVEVLSNIDTIVFDKTGTLTEAGSSGTEYFPSKNLEIDEGLLFTLIRSVTWHSTHPLSRKITQYLMDSESLESVKDFTEHLGMGIQGTVKNKIIKIGSQDFIGVKTTQNNIMVSKVFVSVDNKYVGYFGIKGTYRTGFRSVLSKLNKSYELLLLSGDNDNDKESLIQYFTDESDLYFNQTPIDKLEKIKSLQSNKKTILMIGDGLNDAGALKQSDIGISVTENINSFSPACDGILESNSFNRLYDLIKFSKTSMNIVKISYLISFLYNFVGLSFAVQGTLSPLISAIVMPISSISVVIFTTVGTNLLAKLRLD